VGLHEPFPGDDDDNPIREQTDCRDSVHALFVFDYPCRYTICFQRFWMGLNLGRGHDDAQSGHGRQGFE
ncbi:MAG: hypothetical protein ACKO23_06445, partial [Gemmataceae bacterium]